MSNLERDIAPNKRSGIPRASESLCRRFARVLSVPEADVLHLYGYASAPREPQTVREFKARLAELGVHLETDDDVDDSPEALENLRHSLAAFLQAISKKK